MPDNVSKYYDQYTDGYLKTYGNTIQAFRPSSLIDLHNYIAKSADLENANSVLDAGCGVCGPSVFYAQNYNVQIEALTISDHQVKESKANISAAGLNDRIHVQQGDYHNLPEIFTEKKFDRILFLESLGHAHTSQQVIDGAASLLNDEGCIYVKDFFPFDIEDAELRAKHERVIANVNKYYEYNVLNLHETIKNFRRNGLEIVFIRKMRFKDDIQARFDFEEMHNVDLFEEMQEFMFAEWLELCFRKPSYPLF